LGLDRPAAMAQIYLYTYTKWIGRYAIYLMADSRWRPRLYPMTDTRTQEHRAYVEVGGRSLHYRRCGHGPAVVMLHDSPRSSRLHLATMRELGRHFTVFAMDTPGYGNSDPLGVNDPTIEDFAAALGDALRALGLTRAPLYATHTSAKIALAYAASGCELPLLLLDGLSMPETLASEAFIATYMRPFTPEPTGAYLAGEWSRLRDMLRWFPWFAHAPAARIAMDAPDAAWMLDYNIDLFAAGPHYADAYAAAMRYDPAPSLARVGVPTVVVARKDDVLHGYLPRAAASGNPHVSTQSLPAERAAWLNWLETTLAPHALSAPPPTPQTGARRYTAGQLHWTIRGQGAPWVILSAPTTLHAHAWAAALAGQTYVPDLPGYGDSDPQEDVAKALNEAMRELGLHRPRILAIGAAAPLAARMDAELIVIDGMPPAKAHYPPVDFDPLAGSHLHRIWHMLRDGEAQYPWHDASPAAIRRLPPLLDAGPLHAALTGVLKQPQSWGEWANEAKDDAIWHHLTTPVIAFTHADPAYARVPSLAQACGARLLARPDTLPAAATLLSEIL
jgi:hypothetical protein